MSRSDFNENGENQWTTFCQDYLEELNRAETSQQRRMEIGGLLAQLNDPRPGIGVKNGCARYSVAAGCAGR